MPLSSMKMPTSGTVPSKTIMPGENPWRLIAARSRRQYLYTTVAWRCMA